MKFKISGMIEVEPLEGCPGWVVVTKTFLRWEKGERLPVSYLTENKFSPADCEALNLVDPNRTERLCPPIIKS